jgi:type III pantothenate kinase
MILAADIGNTNITLGVYETGRLRTVFRMKTDSARSADEYGRELLRALREKTVSPATCEAVAMVSVVPRVGEAFRSGVRMYMEMDPFLVHKDIKTGLSVQVKNAGTLGMDRLVNAAAAYRAYGGPVMAVDFGTATTYDVVTGSGVFVGGVIAPGVRICAEALWEKGAQLPKVRLERPDRVLGTDTESSMRSGVYYGYLGQVNYLIGELKRELGTEMKTVATGGLSHLFEGGTAAIDFFDDNLTLNGLHYLYQINR